MHTQYGKLIRQVKKSIILYLISGETAPNFVIRNSFENHFQLYHDFDWLHVSAEIGLEPMHQRFIELLKAYQPDYCFMQIQNPAKMNVHAIREMARYTKIIHWSGDVRNSPEWYHWMASIGREIHLTLLCNETDVEKMREQQVRAAYLQIGFDNILYQRKARIQGWPDIVFVANADDKFDLSKYRAETVLAMYEAFPRQFRIFGAGWERWGIHTERLNNSLEAECYNSCKIALSVSNFFYKRYHSDRLLRIMACGCCAISHHFPELEKDFTPGCDIVTFLDHTDLISKCGFYLNNAAERCRIGDNAFVTAHTKCTWNARCRELLDILDHCA